MLCCAVQVALAWLAKLLHDLSEHLDKNCFRQAWGAAAAAINRRVAQTLATRANRALLTQMYARPALSCSRWCLGRVHATTAAVHAHDPASANMPSVHVQALYAIEAVFVLLQLNSLSQAWTPALELFDSQFTLLHAVLAHASMADACSGCCWCCTAHVGAVLLLLVLYCQGAVQQRGL